MSFDWTKLKSLQEQRAAKYAEFKGIFEKAESEKRDLTEDEAKRFDTLRDEIDKIDPELERLTALRDISRTGQIFAGSRPPRDAIGQPEQRDDQGIAFSPLKGEWEKRTVKPEADGQFRSEPLSISKYIRGVMLGDWQNADAERRALATTGVGSAIVPTPLSANLIQGAFSASRVMQAGALTVPMDAATLKMARVAGAPQAAWKAENAAANVADGQLDSVTFTAKTLAVVCKLSLELNEDAKNADAVIQQEMGKAMGLSLDAAALYGTGTLNDPVGLANISGVQSISSVGSLSNYSNFSIAAQKIMEVNGAPNAVILAPNSYGILDRLTDTLGQPMRKPDSVAALNFLPTNQVKLQPVTVTITGSPTGGTFAISVTAGGSTQTTSGIAYNASAATVQAALVALSNVGTGNAAVTGSGPYTITFAGSVSWLGATKVSADGTSLTGGTSPAATATAVTNAFVGDFRQLMVGMRQTLIIEASREAADSASSAWVNGQLFLRAWMRCDIQAAHPNQFCILNGITVS